jgi:hypothetical protein
MPQPFGEWAASPPEPVLEQFTSPVGFERNVMFLDQMKHFLAVAHGEAKPVCALHDGIRALEMALEARGESSSL